LQKFGGEVEVAFKVGGVGDVEDKVVLTVEKKFLGFGFFLSVVIE
jgi:hypothetical protein